MNELNGVSFYGTTQDTLQYVIALSQLDNAQQKAILSLHGYTAAQQENILKMALSTTKLQEYNIAWLENKLLATDGELATKLNAKANDQLTMSMIKQLAVEGTLNPAQKKRLLSLIEEIGATELANLMTKQYTLSMKELATVMLATPMGWLTILTTILPFAIAGAKWLVKHFQDQVVTLQKLTDEYQKQQETLEGLNSEQEKNAERIKELNELKTAGEITLAQEEELKRLQRQNDLLQAQILMYEELNKSKKAQISDQAVAEAQQFFSGETVTEDAWGVTVGEDSGIVKLERAMLAYQRIQSQIEEETAKGANADQKILSKLEESKSSQLTVLTELSDEMQNYAANIDATDPANQELLDMLDLNINKVTLLVGGVQAFETVWNRIWSSDSPVKGADKAAKQLGEAADAQAKWNAELKKYGSNVDLTNRKILKGSDLAGNDIFQNFGPNDYATLYSHTYTASDFGGTGTQAILVTPILPDGSVFESKKDFNDYIASLMKEDGSGFDLSKDTKGITLGLFDEGSIDASIEKADQVAMAAHEVNQAFDELYQSGTVQQVVSLLEEMGVDISDMPIGEFAAMFEKLAANVETSNGKLNISVAEVDKLRDGYSLLKTAQEEYSGSNKLSDSTLKSMLEQQESMEEIISLYKLGFATAAEVYSEYAKLYESDRKNFVDENRFKIVNTESYFNKNIKGHKEWVDAIGEYYASDYKNFAELAQKKLAIETGLIQKLGENWSKYYSSYTSALESTYYMLDTKSEWERSKSQGGYADYASYDAWVRAQKTSQQSNWSAAKRAEYDSAMETAKILDAMSEAMKKIDLNLDLGLDTSKSSKAVEAYIADIEKYRDAQKRLNDVQEEAAAIQEKMDRSQDVREQILLQRQLISVYVQEQEALSTLNTLRDQTITENVKKLQGLGFAVQYNAESDELWISNMEHLNQLTATSKGNYDSLQEATNALRKETEELIEATEGLNDANKDGVSDWNELNNNIRDAEENVYTLFDTIVQNASDAVDSIQSVYDTLHDAADEYAESGFISIDTLQSIIELGQKYVAYLIDENGQLVINEDRIQAVIAARTQQMAIESSLSYVEAIRTAKSEGDIETLNNLLYATEDATDATWGFVYANLALAGLDEDQYQAALRNINAIRAMADSAVQSIGKTVGGVTDELEKMQDGLNDILDYVMDMLKQSVQDQIDGLEDMKDSYSEIIDLKKQSLEASKDEADRQKTMASKMREIAKLQARIDILSLDGSREAQAEKAALIEELNELQSDLADEQADMALEAQKDALDKMEESYHDEKDKEIEILEDSISSYQKLYDMAISYIESHWDTLYGQLIGWNTQYGDVLNSEITSAWDNCLVAAERYGDYVSALNGIGGDMDNTQSGGKNYQIGETEYDTSYTAEEGIRAAVYRMKENSALWKTASESDKTALAEENKHIAYQELPEYGVHAEIGSDGVWYLPDGRKLYEIYHKGGIAGANGTLKDNEVFAKLEKGEPVLTAKMWDNLMERMEWMDKLSTAFSNLPGYANTSILPEFVKAYGNTVNNVTNSNRPVEITFGDTIIHGADKSMVEQHLEVNRDMVNQIAKVLKVKM